MEGCAIAAGNLAHVAGSMSTPKYVPACAATESCVNKQGSSDMGLSILTVEIVRRQVAGAEVTSRVRVVFARTVE